MELEIGPDGRLFVFQVNHHQWTSILIIPIQVNHNSHSGIHCLSLAIPVHANWAHEQSEHNGRGSTFPLTDVFI